MIMFYSQTNSTRPKQSLRVINSTHTRGITLFSNSTRNTCAQSFDYWDFYINELIRR